jgi:hypothetical protein
MGAEPDAKVETLWPEHTLYVCLENDQSRYATQTALPSTGPARPVPPCQGSGKSFTEKVRAGFGLYARAQDAPGLKRVLDQREPTAEILSL